MAEILEFPTRRQWLRQQADQMLDRTGKHDRALRKEAHEAMTAIIDEAVAAGDASPFPAEAMPVIRVLLTHALALTLENIVLKHERLTR